jgi:SNF2 family DNA or RNA helicase
MKHLLTYSDFHHYQKVAYWHGAQHNQSMLFQDMGLGKTVECLSIIDTRFDEAKITGALVIAPKRVCENVWRQEAQKWAHTRWLSFSLILGDEGKRLRALMTPANVYLVNYENIPWLVEQINGRYLDRGAYPPFNMLVLDEISRMKNTRIRQGNKRGKALLSILQYFPYRMGLTGTPAGNSLLDLFGQFLCIDGGERLGTSFSGYRKEHFYQTDYNGYRWSILPTHDQKIRDRIADITISMKNDDYLELPPYVFNNIWLELPPKHRTAYDRIERDMIVELKTADDVPVFNAASLTNRCLQYASGAIFKVPGEPEFETLHKIKLDALEEIVEEAAGQPILVAYQFRHEAERILKDPRFKHFKWFHAGLSERDAAAILTSWKDGTLKGIVSHPQSIGHGIDGLQSNGRHIVWYGVCWSWDYYNQLNARLRRQGQTEPVIVHRLLMKDTVDTVVDQALKRKAGDEHTIRQLIKEYWDSKK